jgi:hypothetical protein
VVEGRELNVARRLRVLGLVDFVWVADPAEIRAIDEHPEVDRRFVPRGPLVNRLVVSRIRRWFQIDDLPLPSLAPRGDAVRAARQHELEDALDPTIGGPLWSDRQLVRLAAFVRGESSRDVAAVTVQEIVGRLFFANYRADRDSWRAAEIIDKVRGNFSLAQIAWRITGRIRQARDLLVDRARQDRWAMHGTALGLHGIVQALERMRALHSRPDARSFSDETILGECLAPPQRVPRTVETTITGTRTVDGAGPGAIIMFELEAAARGAAGAEMVFMSGHWNQCPAHAFVRALLLAVWTRSFQGHSGDTRDLPASSGRAC